MAIKELYLTNFRNHRNISFSLSPGISVFTGSNGIGKTSILEAISILGTGRSFRLGKNEDFIFFEKESANIFCNLEQQGMESSIEIEIFPKGKKVSINGKRAKKLSNVTHLLPSVVFSPGDHKIIEGDSSDRKAFLNRAASILDFNYAECLTTYNKVLTQRNQLLKRISKENISLLQAKELLEVWDLQLLEHGKNLIIFRKNYIEALKEKIAIEYRKVSGKEDLFEALYCPFGEEKIFYNIENYNSAVEEYFINAIKDSLRRDILLGTTSDGPHKDEILLTLNRNKVKFYCSQGEKRTCALALRLGEVSLFKDKQKRAPVLLIDDVSSELDSNRRKSLVDLLQAENAQVLITATELPSTLMKDLGKSFVHVDLMSLGEGK